MAATLVGAWVSIYYDSPRRVAPGDALVAPTGRLYVIVDVRVQQRGKHIGRQHLKCVVGSGSETVSGSVYPIFWYRRNAFKRIMRNPRARQMRRKVEV